MHIPGYEILEEIGGGESGVVYRARHLALNRLVALKLLRTPAPRQDQVARFRQEANALARLDHPSIVPVYDAGEHEGQLYLAMKLFEGPDLARAKGQLQSLPGAIAALMATVARAVHHAHEHGILHRDLKPSNVMLDAEGRPHVVDFGLARYRDEGDSLTTTGVVLGSPAYLSPEQAAGRKDLAATSDVYSLGAILYELLTKHPLFPRLTPYPLLLAILSQKPVPPRRIDPRIPRNLEAVCLKCLQRQPGARYATAAELADDLDRFVAGQAVRARPWFTRGRLLAAAFVLGAAGLLMAAGALGRARWSGGETARLQEFDQQVSAARQAFSRHDMAAFFDAMERSPPLPWAAYEDSDWNDLREKNTALRPVWAYTLPRPPYANDTLVLAERGKQTYSWSRDGKRLVEVWPTSGRQVKAAREAFRVIDPETGQELDEPMPVTVEEPRPDVEIQPLLQKLELMGSWRYHVLPSPDGRFVLTAKAFLSSQPVHWSRTQVWRLDTR